MAARRPEHEAPPELYYTGDTARRYARNTRLHDIQNRMTLRALELLALPAGEPCLLLDIGCGTGLSGATLRKAGHTWVGADISREMLLIAKQAEFDAAEGPSAQDSDEEEAEDSSSAGSGSDDAASASGSEQTDGEEEQQGEEAEEATGAFAYTEVTEADMGAGLPFRPGSFDGAVSISAIQWLCVASKRTDVPQRRLKAFFQTLYNSLRRGARAVLQFYPENQQQTDMIVMSAMKCGFGGGLVVDYPHSTRARKFYLVIYAGHAPAGYKPPAPLMGDEGDAIGNASDDDGADEQYGGHGGEVRRKVRVYGNEQRSQFKRRRTDDTARPETGSKQWVLMKKAERRNRGDATTQDSKYTMRRRKPRF